MSAAAVVPMRQQVTPRDAAIMAATRDTAGALTVEACAMYRATLDIARQINALARKAQLAEQSHQRAVLSPRCEALRTAAALLVDDVYRIAQCAPESLFEPVRIAQDELLREAMSMLFPAAHKGAA